MGLNVLIEAFLARHHFEIDLWAIIISSWTPFASQRLGHSVPLTRIGWKAKKLFSHLLKQKSETLDLFITSFETPETS